MALRDGGEQRPRRRSSSGGKGGQEQLPRPLGKLAPPVFRSHRNTWLAQEGLWSLRAAPSPRRKKRLFLREQWTEDPSPLGPPAEWFSEPVWEELLGVTPGWVLSPEPLLESTWQRELQSHSLLLDSPCCPLAKSSWLVELVKLPRGLSCHARSTARHTAGGGGWVLF